MRRTIYYITITTDGMYADPDGGLDYFEPTEEEHRYANHLVRDVGDIVMGRVMYDLMDYWDDLDLDDPNGSAVEREFATFWRDTPKHVASRGEPTLRANATTVGGDLVETVRAMKAQDGPSILLAGGAEFFATMAQEGLIDDYRFLIVPTAMGEGKRLFGALAEPLKLRLTNATTYSSGAVLHELVGRDRPVDQEAPA
jgi:dihydrofolate reductase